MGLVVEADLRARKDDPVEQDSPPVAELIHNDAPQPFGARLSDKPDRVPERLGRQVPDGTGLQPRAYPGGGIEVINAAQPAAQVAVDRCRSARGTTTAALVRRQKARRDSVSSVRKETHPSWPVCHAPGTPVGITRQNSALCRAATATQKDHRLDRGR
jgi:hypothetical protein